MFYLNSTLNFGIPIVFVFQLEVYYKTDRLLTGLTAQQKGTTARWYSNKTSLIKIILLKILFVKENEFKVMVKYYMVLFSPRYIIYSGRMLDR